MSLFTSPPRATRASFKRGDNHLGVWALQRFLNVVYKDKMLPIVEDGDFGASTETAVRRYQADVDLVDDGLVGPKTQTRMVRSCVVRAPHGDELPSGLIEGQIDAESGRYFAAVNAAVAGGLDLGLTQRRVLGPPFNATAVKAAMDPVASVSRSVTELYSRYETYRTGRHRSCPFNAWQLAALHHNWPYAAGRYHKYGGLPDPNRTATWAPASLGRMTWDAWARFYVKSVTKLVKEW